jgi:hypothetical protein
VKNLGLFGTLAVCGIAASAQALTFECRWVEQTGAGPNQFTVIGGNGSTLNLTGAGSHRLRLQFAVIDDAMGTAPGGGFVGWNVGTLGVSGDVANTQDNRTPGRLNPFTFATQAGANGNPPLPGGDPFTNLTDIDATLGTQSPSWVCAADGTAPPQPAALVRGRNTFVSLYEITTLVLPSTVNYSITAGGNLVAATEWRTVGTPIPPDCGDPADPSDDVAGSITYAPFPTAPVPFTCVLNIAIPAPGAAALLGLGGLLVGRRRR